MRSHLNLLFHCLLQTHSRPNLRTTALPLSSFSSSFFSFFLSLLLLVGVALFLSFLLVHTRERGVSRGKVQQRKERGEGRQDTSDTEEEKRDRQRKRKNERQKEAALFLFVCFFDLTERRDWSSLSQANRRHKLDALDPRASCDLPFLLPSTFLSLSSSLVDRFSLKCAPIESFTFLLQTNTSLLISPSSSSDHDQDQTRR